MRIIYIELIGFKRMSLKQKRVFKMDVTERTQLILGTNGSGKSSLMSELTPLPAQKDEYEKGGSKTIQIAHRGSFFELKNDFSQGQKHSFLKDNEELNPGGTVTVQRELVRQEFGVTQEVHDLLTGADKFHQMSPSRRREWFTQLTPITYEYALAVHQRLKDRHRDTVGAMKMAKNRLVVESGKVVTEDAQAVLEKEVKEMHKELDFLMEAKKPVEADSVVLDNQYDHRLAELAALAIRHQKIATTPPLGAPYFTSVEAIGEHIDGIKARIAADEALMNAGVKEHKKLAETLEVLKKAGEEGVKALDQKLDALRREHEKVLHKRKLEINDLDVPLAIQALDAVTETLTEVFLTIPENEDKRFSQATLKTLTDQLDHAKARHAELVTEGNRILAKKEHLASHKDTAEVHCPRCGNGFVPGFSEEVYNGLVKGVQFSERRVQESLAQITALQESRDQFHAYGALYRQYTTCTRSWPTLNPFWKYLDQQGILTHAPRTGEALLATFKRDLGIELEALEIAKKIKGTQELIEQAATVGDSSLAETQLRLEEKELEVDRLSLSVQGLRAQERDYQFYRRQLNDYFATADQLSASLTFLDALTHERVETVRREMFNQLIRTLQLSLTKKEDTLETIQRQRILVKDLESQILKYENEERAAKQLVSIMSPTDGLIAEGLLGFIRIFTSQMNHLIRKIWTYPLVIQNCGITTEHGAELDYKFPMMVHSKDNIVKDVSLGSTGMQEIVDLAFKVTAMQYLGLEESPLFLDEFGRSFDEAHRLAAGACIKSIMDQKPFTQLFMVSHYKSSYGVFTNAEICVLDESNIQLSEEVKYNQHVVFQ